ncbi:MAG TPA: hypothetical protein VGQ59_05250 [Cyclobacteriaceae bacterium]|jgi:hypothetical protein|nr:hypothetical protein [Cyclobacteriaceae bacterium]
MKRKGFLPVLVLASLFQSCEYNNLQTTPDFQTRILGTWIAVDDEDHQLAPEWGLMYEASIKLYPDKTFAVNVGNQPDENIFKLGTWTLRENDQTITFYSYLDDSGTIYKDTTSFNIFIDNSGRLIFSNELALIKHKRQSN